MPLQPAVPVGHLVWLLATRWRAAVDRELAPLGIPHSQYVFMASLRAMSADGYRPSQRELADFSGLDAVYISKLAKALEAQGFLARTPDARDPRAVQLALTASGRSTVDRAIGVVAGLQLRLLAPLGGPHDGRVGDLAGLLRTLLDGADVPVEPGTEPVPHDPEAP